MKVRVFTLRFDAARGGFVDDELRAFMVEADVLQVEQHFFEHEASPWLLLVMRYRDTEVRDRFGLPMRAPAARPAEEPSEAHALDPAQRRTYDALRAWRNARSRTDGVPAYVILTNRQLAAVARATPTSTSGLDAVDGFGERKREAYGADVLRVVAEASAAANGVAS